MSGELKVYNGSVFNWKPVKVWNGTTWVTKPVKYWNGSAWITTNAGGGTTSLSAPSISYPSPLASNPTTVIATIPPDWQATTDDFKLAISSSASMSSPTILTHTITDADAAAGAFNIGLSGVTLVGVRYLQPYGARSGVDSANKGAIVAWGDTTGPAITTSSTQNNIETQPLSITLTATDAGSGVPALLSDGTSPGWYISGGADQLQYEIAIVSGVAKLRWYGNAAQSYASPADQGVNNVYDVSVTAVDYGGNKSTPLALATTVTQADVDPNHQTFASITGAARSSPVPAAETWTIAGLDPIPVPIIVSGLKYRKSTDSGASWSAWGTATGTVVNGDQIQIEADPTPGGYETQATGSITVGSYTATFTVTTLADPANVAVTAGNAVAATISGANGTFANMSFPVTGLGLVVVKCGNVRVTGLTVGGSAATLVVESATATITPQHMSIWQINISSAGNKTVVASTGGFPSGMTAASCVIATGTPASTSSAFRAWGFRANPQTTGTTITDPASGVILAGGYGGAGELPAWQAPMNVLVSDVTTGISIAIARSNDDPSFTHSAAAGTIVAAAWGP